MTRRLNPPPSQFFHRRLLRALERRQIVLVSEISAHHQDAKRVRAVFAQAGMRPITLAGHSPDPRWKVGPTTIDWVIARKLEEIGLMGEPV